MNDTPSHPDSPNINDAGETVGMNDDMTFEESLAIDMPTESGDHCKLTNQPQTEPQDNSTQPAWIGKRMGRFKLLRLIGEGTMGRVISDFRRPCHRWYSGNNNQPDLIEWFCHNRLSRQGHVP